MKIFGTILLVLSLFILGGCTVENPTEPVASYFSEDITAAPDMTYMELFEGQSTTLKVSFDKANRSTVYVSYQIRGGTGRFVRPSGVITAAAGSADVSISIDSFRNDKIETPQEFEVVVDSDAFVEPVTLTLKLIDQTTPAVLQFEDVTELVFPTGAAGQTVAESVVIENVGQIAGTTVGLQQLNSPFSFAGGSFPGTGGTCTAILNAGESCTLVLNVQMASAGAVQDNFILSYYDGAQTQQLTLPLQAACDSVIATLTGAPTNISKVQVLDVTVGGTGITHYKYKVGSTSISCGDLTGYSVQTAVGTHVTANISALADGGVKLCAVGYDGTKWQSEAGATFATWTKDTTPPQNTSISINSGATGTNQLNVTLRFTADAAQFMYVTNVAGCNAGGAWEIFNETRSWTLNYPNNANLVYVKFRDVIGNESACQSAAITHDDLRPTVTINQYVSQTDPSITLPVKFKVLFSEAINDTAFNGSSITQTGTATGITWAISKVNSLEYLLEATAVSAGGTLKPTLVEGGVSDLAGNSNFASTSIDNDVSFNVIEYYMKEVFAGGTHSCGISIDGKAFCWGDNSAGQVGDGTSTTALLKPSQVLETNLSGNSFVKLALGDKHTCGLTTDHKVYCWGDNTKKQLGRVVDLTNTANKPVNVIARIGAPATLYPYFIDIVAGKLHTCGQLSTGGLYCWGKGTEGQLGNGVNVDTDNLGAYGNQKIIDLSAVSGHTTVKGFVAGDDHTCVLMTDGEVYCWGRNTSGQLGDNSTTDRWSPVKVNTSGVVLFDGFTAISAGAEHTCGIIAGGDVYCWGLNTSGQLGTGNLSSYTVPTKVDTSAFTGAKTFVSIQAGNAHTCGKTSDGYIYCWGKGTNGRLGSSITADQNTPQRLLSGTDPVRNILRFEVGNDHACGLTVDSKSVCWGLQSTEGRLGNNSTTESAQLVATDVTGLLTKKSFVKIAAGAGHSCAINVLGQVFCWGNGDRGQLGSGFSDVTTPIQVSTSGMTGSTSFVDISVGDEHSCALNNEGKAYCWGKNQDGQLGISSVTDSVSPGLVDTSNIPSFMGFTSITAGRGHTCALHGDGKMYCWGLGIYGQLGRGSLLSTTKPFEVITASTPGLNFIISASAGALHSCGVSSRGLGYCWGYGALGRLGNNAANDKSYPVAMSVTNVPVKSGFKDVALGAEHSCALLGGNAGMMCWGNGNKGLLGNGDELARMVPTMVDTSALAANTFFGFKKISLGGQHTCALGVNNKVYCWGEGTMGRLGDGSLLLKAKPSNPDYSSFISYRGSWDVVAGGTHTCSVGMDMNVFCFGQGLEGRIGNGSTDNQNVPAKVSYP